MLQAGAYDFTMRLTQNDDCGCESDWSAPVTVTVTDIEVPALFISGCEPNQTNPYRTVHVPITVRSGNPQTYTVSFTDLTRSSFNHSGVIQRSLWGDLSVEARLPLQGGDYALVIDIDGCLYPTTGRVMVGGGASDDVKLIEQRWNDVLTVNNNPETNGGFTFYAYQWYKDDKLIPGATGQYYTEKDGALNGSYHVELRSYAISDTHQATPVSFVSCPFLPLPQLRMAVYPVPVKVNQSFVFTTSLSQAELAGGTLEIYDATGKLHRRITNLSPQMSIEGFAIKGFYFGRLTTRDNEVRDIKIVVL